jgi:predicted SprT family Zn-dependent metalloprotease
VGISQEDAKRIVREALDTLEAKRGRTYKTPIIKWNLRGKSCLGQAVGVNLIRLHPEAAEKLGNAYVETVLHEVAHIVAETDRRQFSPMSRAGRWSAHGAVWREVMRQLGQTPNRCGTLPEGVSLTPARTVERFVVSCGCQQHVITKVRLNKGLGRYHCRKCGGTLTLVGRA